MALGTVRQLARAALRENGVLGIGQPMPDEYAEEVLRILQTMRDEWLTDGLMLYTGSREEIVLITDQQAQTYGPSSADHAGVRPLWINDDVKVKRVGEDYEHPVTLWKRKQWDEESYRTQEAEIPSALYPEWTFPNVTLNLFPIPTTAATLVLSVPTKLATFDDLDTPLAFPEGYEAAWLYNLSERCCEPFRKALTPLLAKRAADAKVAVMMKNDDGPPLLKGDEAIVGPAGFFNIATGDFE